MKLLDENTALDFKKRNVTITPIIFGDAGSYLQTVNGAKANNIPIIPREAFSEQVHKYQESQTRAIIAVFPNDAKRLFTTAS